jgi:hypothetical protein
MIFNRFKRSNFLFKNTNADNVIEYDLILSHWDLFEIKHPVTFDTVQYGDMQRPDILSFRLYGKSEYWWIVCKFNQIDDVWNDLFVGMDLIIPSVADITSFYGKMRKRVRSANV